MFNKFDKKNSIFNDRTGSVEVFYYIQLRYSKFVLVTLSRLLRNYSFLSFFLRMAGISQTRTISHYNTAESHWH